MSFIVETILRSSAVVAFGLAVAFALRRQPASLRHWILAASLALAAAQPAINLVVPAWRVSVSTVTVIPEPLAESTVETTFALEAATPPVASRAEARLDFGRLALWVWAGGAAISLAVLAVGALWLIWLSARASSAPGNWQREAQALGDELGIRRPIRIAITEHPAMLVTWGTIWPVILLPPEAASWSSERVRLVLAHEMAHLRRRDWLVQLFAELFRALNWFNPLFWIACDRLRKESEYACDDVVLDLGIGGTNYASHLVELARAFSAHGRTWLPAPSIARPSTLERRVRAMLNPQLDRRPVSPLRRAALAATMLAVALPIAAASQQSGSPAGTLTDPSGKPLAQATLRLTAENGGQTVEARSDADGKFVFPAVPAGEYMLSVRQPGFAATRHRMQLNGGAVTINLQAQIATLKETVSVDATPHAGDSPRRSYTPQACSASAAGGQLVPPKKLLHVTPRYRQDWIDAKLEASILLKATIGKDGRVRSVENISPVNAEMEDEAMAAVGKWEFSPTYLNCEPVEVQMYVTVSFKLDR